tara:strand:- start:434 stop:772 length:339 start_codon:yes stop_codon:yes gene_type:complete
MAKITKEKLNLNLIEIPEALCQDLTNDGIFAICKKLGESLKRNNTRAYLITGNSGISIAQWLIKKNIVTLPTHIVWGKPPPTNMAAIIFYNGTVWYGSWYEWIEKLNIPQEA